MLQKYFKHYLKSKGFEDVDKVLYSLSYCQGDGCSFTTQLGTNDIQRLVPFIYPEEARFADPASAGGDTAWISGWVSDRSVWLRGSSTEADSATDYPLQSDGLKDPFRGSCLLWVCSSGLTW